MKTCIPRPPQPFQTQSHPPSADPGPALFLGLDVPTESIGVSLAASAAAGHEIRTMYEGCGFGYPLPEELVTAASRDQ